MNNEEELKHQTLDSSETIVTQAQVNPIRQAVPSTFASKPQDASLADHDVSLSIRDFEINAKERFEVEFAKEFKDVLEMQNDPNNQDAVIKKIEVLIKRADFQQELKTHKDYIQCWLLYCLKMRDQDQAIQYMIDNKIGIFEAKVHLNLAFFVEKYHRNFAKSEEVYTKALSLEGTSEEFKKIILKKYNEFSGRMKERINRDIIAKIGEETFNQTIKSKKRKLNDAFPELDVSVGSNDSNSSKKRRFNEELNQCHETFEIYQQGIDFMKSTIKDYQELGVHETCLNELQQRPLSFLSQSDLLKQPTILIRQDLVQQQSSSSKQQDQQALSQQLKSLESLSLQSKEEVKKESLLRPSESQLEIQQQSQRKFQEANLRNNTLHTIGETSLDGHSNTSNVYNSSNLIRSKAEESKMSMEESQIFRTANNSCDEIKGEQFMVGSKTQSIESGDQLSQLLKQITSLIAPNQSQEAQSLLSQLFSLQNLQVQQQPEEAKQNSKASIPLFQQQPVHQIMTQEHTQSNFGSSSLPQTHQRFSYKNLAQEQQMTEEKKDQRKLSGIFMKIFEEGENKRQSNLMNQQQASPIPAKEHQSQSINQFIKSLQNPAPKPFNPKRDSEMQSFNASFFDATPQDSKFTKNINANYSQEFFLKKKTISKGKLDNVVGQPLIEDQDQFQSPFGLVSPMDNRTSARKSNVMKDCCGLEAFVPNHVINQPTFVSMVYQQISGINYQQQTQNFQNPPQFQTNYNYPQSQFSGAMSVFSNYTGRDQPKQSTGLFPPQSTQQAKRDSADSEGNIFQDCVNDFSAIPNQQKRLTDASKLPSALKSASQGNLISEEQSRTGSKSVRFVNNQ